MNKKTFAIIGASAVLIIVVLSVVSIWQNNQLQAVKKESALVLRALEGVYPTDEQIGQMILKDSAQIQDNDAAGWKERYQTVLDYLTEPSLDKRMLLYVLFSYVDSHPYGGDLVQNPFYVSEFNLDPYGFLHFELGIQKSINSPLGNRTLVEYGTFDRTLKSDETYDEKPRSIRGFFVREGDELLDNGVFTEDLMVAPRLVNIRWKDNDTITYEIETNEGGKIENNARVGTTIHREPGILHLSDPEAQPPEFYEGPYDGAY
jgi:hypothetical protein